MIGRLRAVIRARGFRGLGTAIVRRLLQRKARCHATCVPAFREAYGLEIGGPSAMFRRGGLLPVYPLFARLDNCNFSPSTIWEGTIDEGPTFRFDPRRAPGNQFIAEATDLRFARTGQYDGLLASHTLEHTANPLGALAEWARALRPGGTLVVVVPHFEATFDHRRPVTTLEHLQEDLRGSTGEDDETHLPENLALHDLERDPEAGSPSAVRARSQQNCRTGVCTTMCSTPTCSCGSSTPPAGRFSPSSRRSRITSSRSRGPSRAVRGQTTSGSWARPPGGGPPARSLGTGVVASRHDRS